MNIRDVTERLERIRKTADKRAGDAEAHGQEDQLYLELLQSIAEGTCDDPSKCAKVALETQEIAFSRWYE